MYEFYQEKHSALKLKNSRKELKRLYDQIPETTGCMENHAECKAWCCEIQNPQVMYSEFLATWSQVTSNWPKEKYLGLIERSIRNYLNPAATKPCVFWDRETKHCMQHTTRPFNCRMYGQVPEEEFKPRYEQLKIIYEKDQTADLRPQCALVKSVGKPPTMGESDLWFKWLREIESEFVSTLFIHSNAGGSYRTYHDHVLLKLFDGRMIQRMTHLRLKGTDAEKEDFVRNTMDKLKEEKKNGSTEEESKGH
jgi:Fe-S-cluster containining protein